MRSTTFPLLVLICVASAPADAQEVKTRYYLPKSVVTLSATVTTKNTFPATASDPMSPAGTVETSNVSVTLATVPDPSWPLTLTSEAALLSKNSITVEVGGTGLLASVNAKSEGVLGSIVKNVFGAFVSLSRAASGLRFGALTDPEKKYANDQPEPAKRRVELKEFVGKATAQIFEVEKEIIAAKRGTDTKPLRVRLYELQDTLADLRAELALADAHFAAWKSRMEDAKEEHIEHVQDADDLPDDDPVAELEASGAESVLLEDVIKAACTFDGVTKPGCPFGDVVRKTRVVVTQKGLAPEPDVKPDVNPRASSPAVFFRGTRPIALSVYLLNARNKPVRSKRSTEFVVGRRSSLLAMAVHNSKWSTKSVGLVFTAGVLTKVTSETGSELAGAAESLRALPAEYLAALKQANEINGEQAKSRLSGIQAQIDELKKRKELVEAQVTSGESADLAAMQAQAARLDAELKILNSQRALTSAQGPGSADAAVAVQMLTLQNQLVEAQVKQLQLQQQLEELRRKLGGAQ